MARILLADDDAASRDLVSRALLADGHQVAVTSDGQEALDLIKAQPKNFDLVISDIQMPGLDGIGLIEAVRQIVPTAKVLLMSGFEGSLGRAATLESQGVRCISKPFTLDKIRTEVRQALAT